LKDHFNGQPWWDWPEELRYFDRARGSAVAASVAERAAAHAFFQYLFFGQWTEVRVKAIAAGVQIIGDAPIFVARDSADVWANPELFLLDRSSGQPLKVAGVPPDYFSADGQLWGNPLYDWPVHAADGYRWWIRRLAANLELCDVVRIDHFRAFDTYWAIPADAPTARTGQWENGPGTAFFAAVKQALPHCRLIAEDLGELMPSVIKLREATGLPGMTILQFAFGGGSDNLYLPHHLRANSVVYPGTHDNDTTLGWYAAADEKARDHVRRYLRVSGEEVGWDFIRAAYAAVSNLAVVPLQDFLSLGTEARLNRPGEAAGNWQWRYTPEQMARLHRESSGYMRELGTLYDRLPAAAASASDAG
jgi:4-alpha-glucanotransferase